MLLEEVGKGVGSGCFLRACQPMFLWSDQLTSLTSHVQLQAAFGIRNISVKYTDDAGDSVNMDTQGMLNGQLSHPASPGLGDDAVLGHYAHVYHMTRPKYGGS